VRQRAQVQALLRSAPDAHDRAVDGVGPVPVELTERAIRDVIAVMGEWDQDGAQAAESALNWMGWEGEGPLLLRRYDVQLFVWYTLPRKFLTSLEHKREAAEALTLTLEQLGGRAASYAELCRCTETEELLRAWESEAPTARRRLQELLDGSGIEPPDTELLAWGNVTGFEEACVREQVATALEQAIEDGRPIAEQSRFPSPPGAGCQRGTERASQRRWRVHSPAGGAR